MSDAIVAGRKPLLVTLKKKGERIFWCACGRSKTQPFCDGAHKGTEFRPVPYVAQRDGEEVLLCACKRTGRAPFCDGAHNSLSTAYAKASAAEREAGAGVPIIEPDANGRAVVDGGAYALTPAKNAFAATGGWRVAPAIVSAYGATKLSLFIVEAAGETQPAAFADREAVVFIIAGDGVARIGDRIFKVAPETAFAVRPGEAFALAPHTGSIRAAATISPLADEWRLAAGEPAAFDNRWAERTDQPDPAARTAMGDRFYQVIADEKTGALETTQFIGEIPRSRAEMHRHLYEEAIVILSGEGFLWTETKRARIAPGDIVFLPSRQVHSLECTSDNGLRLAGSFYPAGSPAINY